MTKRYRIIKKGETYYIQKPRTSWLGQPTGQWETVGDADWAAVFPDLKGAQDQLRHWRGEDTDADKVIEECSIPEQPKMGLSSCCHRKE